MTTAQTIYVLLRSSSQFDAGRHGVFAGVFSTLENAQVGMTHLTRDDDTLSMTAWDFVKDFGTLGAWRREHTLDSGFAKVVTWWWFIFPRELDEYMPKDAQS